jgi:glutamine amidotransferase
VIGLVDYGMGNRRSVEKALEHVGASVLVSSDPAALARADALVVPGRGRLSQGDGAPARARAGRLPDRARRRRVPLLGICLGMHLFFERSTELGGSEGPGDRAREGAMLATGELKSPQIGWNEVAGSDPRRSSTGSATARPSTTCTASSPCPPTARTCSAARVRRAVRRGRLARLVRRRAVPPEKSSHDGLRLLANWVAASDGGA